MINATSNGTIEREIIPVGNHIAICYKMIHIGTVQEDYMGETKTLNKIRVGWELPEELRMFGDKGELPLVIDREYTLSMHEKSNLRAMLKSWRGKDFTDEEAKSFDVTKLLGKPCMINIIHKQSKDGTKTYAQIAGVTAVPKSLKVPAQINPTFEFNYDDFDEMKFDTLPEFIRQKMATSVEYKRVINPTHNELEEVGQPPLDMSDLPFWGFR